MATTKRDIAALQLNLGSYQAKINFHHARIQHHEGRRSHHEQEQGKYWRLMVETNHTLNDLKFRLKIEELSLQDKQDDEKKAAEVKEEEKSMPAIARQVIAAAEARPLSDPRAVLPQYGDDKDPGPMPHPEIDPVGFAYYNLGPRPRPETAELKLDLL